MELKLFYPFRLLIKVNIFKQVNQVLLIVIHLLIVENVYLKMSFIKIHGNGIFNHIMKQYMVNLFYQILKKLILVMLNV